MWLWFLSGALGAPTAVVCSDTWDDQEKQCYATLDAALQSDAAVIQLSPGVHRTFNTVITERDVAIRALDPSEFTVLAPALSATSDTVLIINGGTVHMDGFTINPGFDYKGYPPFYDLRGIAVTGGATVSIDKMKVFQGFHSINGGGLWIDNGSTVNVTRSEFGSNSSAGTGGHIFVQDSRLTVFETLFDTGAAFSGGGIGAVRSEVVVDRSQFAALSAVEGGGVFAFQSPFVTIGESVLCNLGANYGGAVNLLESCSVTCDFDNNVVQGNSAGYQGGGLWVDVPEGPVLVAQNTFFNNLAGPHGAAAEFFGGSQTRFVNNLIVQNVAAGAAVLFAPLSSAEISTNAWYDNMDFALAGGDGARTSLPAGNLALAQAPVWQPVAKVGLPEFGCGQLAILDWTDSANADLIEGAIGALTNDLDGDGFPRSNDCNDGDASINEGAEEIVGDNIDNNCDGILACFVDDDGDGLGATVGDAIGDCTDAPFVSVGGDCDDSDPEIGACAAVIGGGGCMQAGGGGLGLGVAACVLVWGRRRRARANLA